MLRYLLRAIQEYPTPGVALIEVAAYDATYVRSHDRAGHRFILPALYRPSVDQAASYGVVRRLVIVVEGWHLRHYRLHFIHSF